MKKVYWNKLNTKAKQEVLQRNTLKEDADICLKVNTIIEQVKSRGDEALILLTKEHDKVLLPTVKVSDDETTKALSVIGAENYDAINFAIERITALTQSQLPEDSYFESDGVICQRLWRPISRVGLYVPGGSAALVSTLLMLAIPAKIAKCPQIVLCTPPNQQGNVAAEILVAAKRCGIDKIFKIGGAQAIAAMAHGTQTVPKVDKIFGPGNRYVTKAKVLCSQDPQGARMDLPAGPSEIVIIADASANPEFIAADLLSQAEHDGDARVMLIATCATLIDNVLSMLPKALQALPRQEIASHALKQSAAIVVDNLSEAFAISNAYAPEHLSLQIQGPHQYLNQLQNVGTVFLGKWTPETLGDYVTGANHVLPTNGAAKSYSGLSVMDFMKSIGIQEATKEGFMKLAHAACVLAQMEQLKAHEEAVTIRLKEVIQNV